MRKGNMRLHVSISATNPSLDYILHSIFQKHKMKLDYRNKNNLMMFKAKMGSSRV